MLNLGKKDKKIIPLKVKLSFNERVAIVESLGIMLNAGIPILEALDSLDEDSTSSTTKQVIQIIRVSIQKGQSLAVSFSQFPNIFDDILINTVKSGEESGSLDVVLKEITENMRRSEELKSDVQGAMIYPVIVLTVLFFVLVVLLGFVIPRVAEVFDRLNISKPLPTRILLSTATFFSDYFLYFLGLLVVVIILLVYIFSQRGFRK